MRALIIVVHPDPASLTHAVAESIADGLREAGHEPEFADLTAEGFDPRFGSADLLVQRTKAPPPDDVAAEQRRINAADALVLVFPIYWWSMPALLKGWIDRVFANGWAFEFGSEGLTKKLRHLDVHLVGLGGADRPTWDRHGYTEAMHRQIDHGIFDYCGARVLTSELMLDSGTSSRSHLGRARAIGAALFGGAMAPAAHPTGEALT